MPSINYELIRQRNKSVTVEMISSMLNHPIQSIRDAKAALIIDRWEHEGKIKETKTTRIRRSFVGASGLLKYRSIPVLTFWLS